MVMGSPRRWRKVRRGRLPELRRNHQTMGMSAAQRRRWTAPEVRQLMHAGPEHGPRYELIAGELLVTPAHSARHQRVLAWLFRQLSPFVEREQLGEVLWSPADLELAPGEISQPDLFVVPPISGVRTWSDVRQLLLAVEALSPSTARYDRTLKRPFYQRVGVPDYWIVDLDARLVECWTPSDDRPAVLAHELTWAPRGANTSLRIDLDQLWSLLEVD